MADIKTTKSPVVMLNDPNPTSVEVGLSPNVVHFKTKNEGVMHDAHMTPQEAIMTGVALIQAAQQAQMLGAQAKMVKTNGMPPRNGGGIIGG